MLFRQAIAEAGIGLWCYDLSDQTVLIDAAFAERFGLPERQPFEEFVERFPGDCRFTLEGAIARAMDPNMAGRLEITCPVDTGQGLKWILVTGRCAFAEEAGGRRPVAMAGAAQDVTELKRIEVELREHEAWLNLALDAGGIGTFSFGDPVVPARCSPLYRRLLGFRPDEDVVEKTFLERVHPEDRPRLKALIDEAIREGTPVQVQYRIVLPDGRVRWIEASTRALKEPGRLIQVMGVVRDVTEQREADRTLRDALDRLSLAIDAAGIGTWDWDFRSGTIQWDLQAQRIVGAEEHPEVDYAFVRGRMHPDDQDRIDATVARVMVSTGPASYSEEFRVRRPDGTTRWLLVKGRTHFEEGRPIGFVGVGMDITERKLAEEHLGRLAAIVEASDDFISTADAEGKTIYMNAAGRRLLGVKNDEELHRLSIADYHPAWAVEQANQGLLVARETGGWLGESAIRAADGTEVPVSVRIVAHRCPRGWVNLFSLIARDISERKEFEANMEAAARQKDEFLAMLGHELRNPLAAVGHTIEVLKLLRIDAPQLGRLVQVMDRQTTHMRRLLDDLLDVSRITRGKIKLEKQRFDLRDVVRDVISDQRDRFARAGLTLETDVAEEPLDVYADPTRVAQILSNLVDNARKFTDPPGSVAVRVFPGDKRAVLEVQDTGIGFDMKTVDQLFVAFQQFSRSGARASGLGLGLALVKGLVELHGGDVTATSPGPGKGACFRVRLPLSAFGTDRARKSPEARRSEQSHRVLVVDDNRDSADMLGETLELLGHEVAIAYDAHEAIEEAHRFHPDTVLCDIGLPGPMSGYDVARALRESEDLREAHLVAVTGYGRPEDREAARRAGFDDHLTKPVRLPQLEAVLSSLH
jgi:PAS domain S-box-containing protein